MKTTVALLALFILILGGGYLLKGRMPADTEAAPVAASAPTSSTSTAASRASSNAVPGVYTSAQVARHATSGNCWASINGGVYDLTSWIPQHPGGEARILSICGKDGSASFNAQHGSDPNPEERLASFKVGMLAP